MAPDLIARFEKVKTDSVRLNALAATKYCGGVFVDDLVESISRFGILEPLLVLPNGTVLSGVRRLMAARRLGLEEVPVVYLSLEDPDEIEAAIAVCNRPPNITNEQKTRAFMERKRTLGIAAERRKKSGKSADGQAGGRGHRKSGELNAVWALRSSETAAAEQGWSHSTAQSAKKVMDYADATGDHSVIDILNNKSVEAAVREVERKKAAAKGDAKLRSDRSGHQSASAAKPKPAAKRKK